VLALPEPAVFDPVAAGGHVAPGACPAVRAVVEGPLAIGIAAGLQPLPGAVALCVADRQQQGHQPGVERAAGPGGDADLAVRPDLQHRPDGADGGLGVIIFYLGLAAGPMSVVAPVSGLVSTVLPVAVALAEGERPGTAVYAGALLCLAAVVLISCAGGDTPARSPRAAPRRRLPGALRALAYGIASGASFGLFFLLIRNAGQSGELWPVAAARIGELAVVLVTAAVLRRSLRARGAQGRLRLAAAAAGAIDVTANICYVAATRTGKFGLAVVLAALYPAVTVLLARVVLGEWLRWVQRAGLGLAAIGIILVTT